MHREERAFLLIDTTRGCSVRLPLSRQRLKRRDTQNQRNAEMLPSLPSPQGKWTSKQPTLQLGSFPAVVKPPLPFPALANFPGVPILFLFSPLDSTQRQLPSFLSTPRSSPHDVQNFPTRKPLPPESRELAPLPPTPPLSTPWKRNQETRKEGAGESLDP